jgi:hypothetical protein
MIRERYSRTDGIQQPQDYIEYAGSYAVDSIFEQPHDDDTDVSVEEFLGQRIAQELAVATDPVVFLDIGGGASLTALRLGHMYQEAIADSRLAIVTTNAELPLLRYISELSGSTRKEASELYHHYNIHDLTADFMQRYPDNIKLPDGTRHSLIDGGTSIVHERLSLTSWTKDPIRQLDNVGNLLSSRSIYMVPTEDIEHRQTRYLPKLADELKFSHQVLCRKRGLEECHSIDEGPFAGEALSYTVFKGVRALPLRAEPVQD